MPALSPTMEEGTLAKWLVKEGDSVTSGQVIAEIETDKATMEFEAVDEGTITRLLVAEGAAGVKVNAPIAELAVEGEEEAAAPAAAPAPEAAASAAPAPEAPAVPAPAPAAPAPATRGDGTRIFATPLARRIAADKGLDLASVTGTGPQGRIRKADVEAASPTPAATAAPSAPAASAPQAAPASPPVSSGAVARLYEGRRYETLPLDNMRRTIAARLVEAKQTIPHFYLRRTARIDALLALRAEMNAALAPRGVKLSVNDFIIKASALALQQVPAANAVWAGDAVLKMAASDVAVAVAVEGGLFTPVLRDAETKGLAALSTEMKDLAARARDRKLAPAEYMGGSFAISNLGMMGIESFDAVINPPQAAILAVGAGVKSPVVAEDGTLAVATTLALTLSVDHRVIDGALGAELLGAIVCHLEAPLGMLA
ncbi:pyruvate dehydrogenase complex dihydrolipoamide acetyltransferase [Phaeovulum vinaykumarii]|uniref:Acetyltransferase component of pyruvate dehydrogenase complex n=1 Tax=Phaeovulum vinaykumarii TaxID=407234 RepID=A0A1N7JQE5_9RHOB|nr:pyruvate dehydrogenase complex dihydrolipoamide acetyltransferase [Phaeovulum vinaykumarii]SIS51578.1 pyruvate dehydrogenase E2 component (dihydrolipoamide acetyltransferase) [Phaeovulum vinaykumarii]SOB90820.1 pyruvate dehydrogenase E2 component (dihydrolipoamide acetyltransferase) [Phaeovulum vinaykumarii]